MRCGGMAKSRDTEQLDWSDPAATRIFNDGPQAMLLDPDAAPSETAEELVSLSLADLLPDDAGEVVLVATGDVPINLLAGESLTEVGIAPAHVTAGGMEVTGLNFYSFESGLTVYSPTDLLILNDPNA